MTLEDEDEEDVVDVGLMGRHHMMSSHGCSARPQTLLDPTGLACGQWAAADGGLDGMGVAVQREQAPTF
jgi:hypothetical protein